MYHLTINKKDKKDFLNWFHDIWSSKFSRIRDMREKGNSVYFTFDLNKEVLGHISNTLEEDKGIVSKIEEVKNGS